jgi:hypothetical protein
MFSEEQKRKLADVLDKSVVKTRKGEDGKAVPYVEGWYVIDKANEIFGFGNWDAETTEMRREHEPILVNEADPESPAYQSDEKRRRKPYVVVAYSARVRLTVWNLDGSRKIVRERCGGHRGFAATAGMAIENCIKAAETDATKRAFATLGYVFGLALYDKEYRHVGTPEDDRQLPADRRAAIDVGFADVPAESGRESGARPHGRAPESAPPRPSNSERALARLEPRPAARGTGYPNGNGGLRY